MDAQPQPDQADRAPRVLVVDDNPAMRRVLQGLLEDVGMDVVGEASDGLEGVNQAERLRPDVVLMDWRMPGLDGLAATTEIRTRLPEVQVVMFSAAESDGMAAIAVQAGASVFVAKGPQPSRCLRQWWPPGGGRHHPNHHLTADSCLPGRETRTPRRSSPRSEARRL